MMMKTTHDSPILVTGAAGAIGAIGRNLTAMLLAKGHKGRALVRREDQRADALRRLRAYVVQGDLTDLASMHRAIEGCARISDRVWIDEMVAAMTMQDQIGNRDE